MIHSRFINRRVENLHKRRPRPIYSDKTSSYEEALKKDGSVSIDYKNIQSRIEVEMFKIKNGMSTVVVSDIFFFGREIITTSGNLRQLSSTSYTNSITVYESKQKSSLKTFKEPVKL